MRLLPIAQYLHENTDFASDANLNEILTMTLDFYTRVGFYPPWICYFVEDDDVLVGSAGIKGKPINGKIEIAYGTFERFQHRSIGTKICRALVELSLVTDPSIIITARTLPTENFSTRILKKNNFVLLGEVMDPEDGIVWEWKFQK
jgi:[ribosomal protein S5]-alanine N-acetyltransferase